MQDIEPHYAWRDYYKAEEDELSPFYNKEYSEFFYSNKVYNYVIHPQWDNFGSDTLYAKILFVHYEQKVAIIELLGEWNDLLYNDIMPFKNIIIDKLITQGIKFFVIIGEHILTFHSDSDEYYCDWFFDIEAESAQKGWICFVNFNENVKAECRLIELDKYIHILDEDIAWRTIQPKFIFGYINDVIKNSILNSNA